jgi:hypothetical protein
MDIRQETVTKVRTTEAQSRHSRRTTSVSLHRLRRYFRSLVQHARNRMVVVFRTIPSREHPAAYHRIRLGQDTPENDRIRRLTTYHSFSLPLHEPPKRRQYFRPEPSLRASHRFGRILRHLWWHLGVRVGRLRVSRIDTSRANRLPPTWPRVAACLSPTVDVHLDSGVLEFPLAPVRATRFHRVWSSSRQKTLREARRAHGRICPIRLPSPSRLVGGRKWDGIRHGWGVLLTHGRRGGRGGSFHEDDGVEGPRMAWVGMDDGVDDCVGYVDDRWVVSIWSTRYRISPERISTRESGRRRHYRPVKQMMVA